MDALARLVLVAALAGAVVFMVDNSVHDAAAKPPSTTNVVERAESSTGSRAPGAERAKAAATIATRPRVSDAGGTKAGASGPSSRAAAGAVAKGYSLAGEGVRGVLPNDDCVNAVGANIGDVVFGSTVGAAMETVPFCGTAYTIGGVWYSFVGNGTSVRMATCGSGTDYDSKLFVYSGGCDGLVCVAGNDDACGASGLSSAVIVPTSAGETYWVLVSGFSSAQGNFELAVGDPPPPDCSSCPPGAEQEGEGVPCGLDGDFFNGGCNSNPEVFSAIECGMTVCGSGAFDSSTGVRDTDWYQITVPEPLVMRWYCDSANFDWQVFIINLNAGCAGQWILGQASGEACASGHCFAAVIPGTYAVVMAPQFGDPVACEAGYTCTLTCEVIDFVTNDECVDAIVLEIPSTSNGSTLGAQPDDVGRCGTSVDAGGVWFTVTGTGTTITASLCGETNYDAKLNVYCGSGCEDLFCVAGNDDSCGLKPRVSFCSTAGQTYWILVQGFGFSQGEFQLDLSEDGVACAATARCEAIAFGCDKSDLIEGEFEAGKGAEACGLPVDFYNGGCNSVPVVYGAIECGDTVCGTSAYDGFTRDTDWYLLPLSGPTLVVWSMEDAAFDWQLFIVDMSEGCAGLVVLGQGSGSAGTPGEVQAITCGAGTYALIVATQFADAVDCPSGYRAGVTCMKAILPEFGDCDSPFAVEIPSSTSGFTQGTDCSLRPFACGTSVDGGGAWYSVQGTGTTITASLCSGTSYDSKLFVYCGDDCEHLFCVAGDDDFCGGAGASQVSFCSVLGETYRIFVSGFADAQGAYTLTLSEDGVACEGAAACEPIVIQCEKADVSEGEYESGEGCGIPNDFFNGGCNSVPAAYGSVECGQVICGTAAYDPDWQTRDTDWYSITITEPTHFTWTMLDASFEWMILILEEQCGVLEPISFRDGAAGESGSAYASVAAGTYRMFVASKFVGRYPCPSAYRVQLTCRAPCDVECDGTPEGEIFCGGPSDAFNGGCNSVPPVFSTINTGDTICGRSAVNRTSRDTDWYAFTNDTGSDVTARFTVAAQFPAVIGYVEWQPGFEGSGDCAGITGELDPVLLLPGDCEPATITKTVGPGVHWLFVAPQFAAEFACTEGFDSEYVANFIIEGTKDPADCNENGIADADDIAAGVSLDCFDYAGASGTRGGANGVPDECECVADWNRDGVANSTDVSDFINTFFADQISGGVDGDVNCDGVSNSTDVSDFINVWFAAQAGQLPFAGCVI